MFHLLVHSPKGCKSQVSASRSQEPEPYSGLPRGWPGPHEPSLLLPRLCGVRASADRGKKACKRWLRWLTPVHLTQRNDCCPPPRGEAHFNLPSPGRQHFIRSSAKRLWGWYMDACLITALPLTSQRAPDSCWRAASLTGARWSTAAVSEGGTSAEGPDLH